MLTVISPAKKLDLGPTAPTPRPTRPRLLEQAADVVEVLRARTPANLATLMKISGDLATLNAERYRAWSVPFTTKNSTPAILAFDGDVYANMARDEYVAEDFTFAQKHLRILSGLYGLLRPLDLVQAYRLEMGTRLPVGNARDLYDYWGAAVAKLLRRDVAASGSGVLVNLASDEYFGVVRTEDVGARVVKPVFKEKRDGAWKVIAFSAKRARGAMVDFIVRERVEDVEALRAFDRRDYRFSPKLSSDDEWVFTRG